MKQGKAYVDYGINDGRPPENFNYGHEKEWKSMRILFHMQKEGMSRKDAVLAAGKELNEKWRSDHDVAEILHAHVLEHK